MFLGLVWVVQLNLILQMIQEEHFWLVQLLQQVVELLGGV
jgi:hypothetical protein